MNSSIGRQLFNVALYKFQKLKETNAFYKIPFNILVELLDSYFLQCITKNA